MRRSGDRDCAPAANVALPEHCTVVNGRGKWLIPGLADMHVHFISEALIDGFPPIRPGTRVVADPAAAQAAVAEIAAAGFDFVKVYSRLTPEVFATVLSSADDAGIRVIGHIPGSR